jgi:uncharacterized protein (DUF2147 family)
MSGMKTILTKAGLVLFAATLPVSAAAQAALEGKWANPKRSVIVNVARCGDAICGTVAWASPTNREKGVTPGKRVLSDLKPLGDGTYRGRALEPKRNLSGSALVHQDGPNVMVVKGCAFIGLVCKEQRWTRVNGG